MSPNELELVQKLRRLDDEYRHLTRQITLAGQSKIFRSDPEDAAQAAVEEQRYLQEMSRVMDRIRAVESGLGRVRRGLTPAVH